MGSFFVGNGGVDVALYKGRVHPEATRRGRNEVERVRKEVAKSLGAKIVETRTLWTAIVGGGRGSRVRPPTKTTIDTIRGKVLHTPGSCMKDEIPSEDENFLLKKK